MAGKPITIMGIFAADLAFGVKALPGWGETVLGSSFRLGPGGKGSNQAVAAARLGSEVHFITKIGRDMFGGIALEMYKKEGVHTNCVVQSESESTGAAAILVEDGKGENAIVVTPGAASALTPAEIETAREQIGKSCIFMTQLELPVPIVTHGLRLARELNVPTVLNPAPACTLPDEVFGMCDYITPNEVEAESLTGRSVASIEDAEKAARILLTRGVKNVILTLGARGAFLYNNQSKKHVAAFTAGTPVETTGAGDAFNAGLAVALSEGRPLEQAVAFGCAVAGISVTRYGTAPAMPSRSEADTLFATRFATNDRESALSAQP